MNKSKLLFALIASFTFSPLAIAKMYKWVDDKGTTHYGESIPAEYANKSRTEFSDKGRAIRKEEVLTPEQRRAKEASDEKARRENEAALAQKRHDKALISTYSNTAEIDLAKRRNLQQVEARSSSLASQLKMSNDSLQGLREEAAARTKAGRPVAKSLQEDIADAEARKKKLQEDLDKTKAEKAAVDARYEAEKARYKELTGK